MSRVLYAHPTPFTEAEIDELSRPFEEQGKPLSEEARKAIYLASGGNPALVTYGLERLWNRNNAAEHDVAEVYAEFMERHPDFLRDIRDAIAHPDFSEAPLNVWRLIQDGGGHLPRAELLKAATIDTGKLRMDLLDILRLLMSAGLIVVSGSMSADPLQVRATASILNLQTQSKAPSNLHDRLVNDLRSLLSLIHGWSPDFFRPGSKGEKKSLVPESVFTAFLGLGLRLRGWTVEREAIHGAGRTDLKLTRPEGTAIVEMKIWERNDYKEIHRQVESYWGPSVVAGAAVLITDGNSTSFKSDYRHRCLDRPDLTITEESVAAPLQGRFVVESTTKEGFPVRVDHLLLRIPRD